MAQRTRSNQRAVSAFEVTPDGAGAAEFFRYVAKPFNGSPASTNAISHESRKLPTAHCHAVIGNCYFRFRLN